MADQKNKRRGGFYWLNDKPYVSVTQVIKVINKPALQYWFGKQVYYAVVAEPEISERDALVAPYKTSKKAMARGTEVHEFVEFYKAGAELPERFQDGADLAEYKNAFVDFLSTHDLTLVTTEKTVVNHDERYAGTLDIIAVVNGVKMLIDVKTNKDGSVYDEVGLQLSAYKHALGEDLPTYALALGGDGSYTFKKMNDVYDYFLAAKSLWEWQNKSKCESVGYFEKGLFDESND